MITELSSIAFALAGMNPAPLLTPVLALQDGRMEKFVAAPRGIKIPVGEEIGVPVPAAGPTREGSTTVVQGVIIQMDHAPIDQIERRISIRINGLQAVQVIDALQAQQVNMMIDMNRFPMSSNLFISLDALPESTVMKALGEALGGAFRNRTGVWVWSDTPGTDITSVPTTTNSRSIIDMVRAKPATEAKAPISTAIPRPADHVTVPAQVIKLSPAQRSIHAQRGFLKYSDLSKYQQGRLGKVAMGEVLTFGEICIRA